MIRGPPPSQVSHETRFPPDAMAAKERLVAAMHPDVIANVFSASPMMQSYGAITSNVYGASPPYRDSQSKAPGGKKCVWSV
jgi:hypothetical protein